MTKAYLKFSRAWQKSWWWQSAYKSWLCQKCTWSHKCFKSKVQSLQVRLFKVNCTKVKSWHVAESSKLQHPKSKFQSLLRAASMTMYHGVSPGKFQFSTALRWSLVIGMCISIESSGLLLKLLKYCTRCKVLRPWCTQLTKVWFSKVLESDLKSNWIGLWKWTK